MRLIIILPLLFIGISLGGQNALFGDEKQTVRALVIGISDYENDGIKDLNYADQDAKAFAGYLQKIAKVPTENIRLLLNKEATSFRVGEELSWLIQHSAKGDKAIIYFSGHGDKETTTSFQLGFLLTYNSPPTNYFGGGAFDIGWLKAAINTLTNDKEVEVIVISDACRSGKLSGSRTGGIGAATAALATSFGKEGKILSCEADQFSQEGTQWGGGRGVFSYHLINGLIGLADEDSDGVVTLDEIEEYLEDKVPPEVAPKKQKPFTVGSSSMVIAEVIPEELAKLKEEMEFVVPTFEATASRGFEEQVIANAGSEVQGVYDAYQKSLADKRFLTPEEDCADFYYRKLMETEKISAVHSDISRHFAAKLQEGSQEAYEMLSSADSLQLVQSFKKDPMFSKYPDYLNRAAEILGEKHYMYKALKGRAANFSGLVKKIEYRVQDKDENLLKDAYAAQLEALQYEEDNPNAYYNVGMFLLEEGKFEEAIVQFEKAIELAPYWGFPYDGLAQCHYYLGNIEKAAEVAENALVIANDDETRSFLLRNSSSYFYYLGDIEKAHEMLVESAELTPEDPYTHYQLGILYQEVQLVEEAEDAFLTALQLDPTADYAMTDLGWLYQSTGRYDEAEVLYRQAFADNPEDPWFMYYLGTNSYYQGNYVEAEKYFRLVKEIYPVGEESLTYLAFIAWQNGDLEEAADLYLQTIEYDPYSYGAHHNLSLIYENLGRVEEATVVAEEGKLYQPYDFNILYQLARMYFAKEEWELSEANFQEALEMKPDSSYTLLALAQIHRFWGNEAQAREYEALAAQYNTNY